MAHVTVVGSINQDIVVQTERFPGPGETLLAESVSYNLGGKGANQAAAAARAGVDVSFVGLVGDDAPGQTVRAELSGFGVDVANLGVREGASTGTAHITVDSSGENTILVVGGTNALLDLDDVRAADETLGRSDVLVLQCEVPTDVDVHVLRFGRARDVDVVLNLAPAIDFPREELQDLAVLVVNETEAALVLGDAAAPDGPEQALDAARRLRELGPRRVVITLGKQGAVFDDGARAAHVPAGTPARVVDTTGAGDATVGVLAASLALGIDFGTAVANAMRAGAAAVENSGAAAAYPEFTLKG